MNPLIWKLGASVVSAVVLMVILWRNRREQEYSSQSHSGPHKFDGQNTTCYICLEDFNSSDNKHTCLSLPCKHKYHKRCIQLILEEISSVKTCPVCRSTIPASFISTVSFS